MTFEGLPDRWKNGRYIVDFGNWRDRWRDKVEGHFQKSGGTDVGFSACKSLKGERYPFCCFFCRKLTLAEQRFCAVTPYYI